MMARRGNEILESYQQRLRAHQDRQLLHQSCAFCGESMEGPLGEVREWALAHRLEHHPDVKPGRRAKRRIGSPRSLGARTLDENILLTRAQGGGSWASDDLPLA